MTNSYKNIFLLLNVSICSFLDKKIFNIKMYYCNISATLEANNINKNSHIFCRDTSKISYWKQVLSLLTIDSIILSAQNTNRIPKNIYNGAHSY